MDEADPQLTTLHSALQAAALAPRKEPDLIVSSFKVREDVLVRAGEIIEANGATVSSYLRKCLELLVADYVA